jgi:predicted nucleic acid-binding Zn ribbon protein
MPASRDSGKPKRLGEILASVLHDQGLDAKLRRHRVVVYWEEFAGREIAARSRATALDEAGTLHVEVDSAVWMQELQMLKDRLKAEINRRLGSEEVRSIRLRLGSLEPS